MSLICCLCDSPEWITCQPGTEAQPREEGGVCWLYPAAEIPLRAWCVGCWLAARDNGDVQCLT